MSSVLEQKIRDLNAKLDNLIGFSLTEETLPLVSIIEDKGFFGSVLDKARGYGKEAGANRETRTMSLKRDATDSTILHELTHFAHWDLQDEEGVPKNDSEKMQLIRQTWEEGVAVFVELEDLARSLMSTRGVKANNNQIEQERLNVFSDNYKKGETFNEIAARFTALLAAVERMSMANTATTEDLRQLKAGQVLADIRTIATSKDTVYDVGYHFVIDAVRMLIAAGKTQQEAIATVMQYPPLSLDHILDSNIYLHAIH